MISFARSPIPAFVLGCAACTADSPRALQTVQDSAGVRIVTSAAPQAEWSVSHTPDLVIGDDPDDGSAQFSWIRQALTLSDGSIAVTDVRTYSIRTSDARGRHIRTIGREGGGPGEFSDDPIIAIAGADTIVAWDQWTSRLSWFDTSGILLRERDMREPILATELGRARGTDW